MRRTLAIALAALALTLTGCRSSREHAGSPRRSPTPPPAAEQVTTPGTANAGSGTARREYTVVNFTGEAEGISFNGQLRVAKDSAVWLSVNKLVELGRAVATPDSVRGYEKLGGHRFEGDYRDVGRKLKRSIGFAELQAAAEGDGLEELVEELARSMGLTVSVRIKSRQRVEQLAFPFK